MRIPQKSEGSLRADIIYQLSAFQKMPNAKGARKGEPWSVIFIYCNNSGHFWIRKWASGQSETI
jgi:hypothetical protein